MRRNFFGLTLLELLVVMLIFALLVSLILPVISNARRRGNDTVCISNMRQILVALNLYHQDYGYYPRSLRPIPAYTKTLEVFACPLEADTDNPFRSVRSAVLGIPKLSYKYFANWVHNWQFALEYLKTVEPNHGILACVWIPINLERADVGFPVTARYVRRGLVGGSVVVVKRRPPSAEETLPEKPGEFGNGCYNGWSLFTNAPCPPEVCRHPDCSI